MLLRLALMMVADGEGATKVVRLRVRGAAHRRGRADGGPGGRRFHRWCKTAIYGCDPNWGRILSAVGAALPGRLVPAT